MCSLPLWQALMFTTVLPIGGAVLAIVISRYIK